MALADATVRVILDLTRFDRDLETKVAAAARRAGKSFESEFQKSAGPAADNWAKDFGDRASRSMRGHGQTAGTQFGDGVRRTAVPSGYNIGVAVGRRMGVGMNTTTRSTATAYSQRISTMLASQGTQIGQRVGRSIAGGIGSGGGGNAIGQRLQRDMEPGILNAARNIGSRFGTVLGGALAAAAPGRIAVLGTAITLLVSEGIQLAAAIAPAVGALGLIPPAAAVAGAAVGTLMVAFKGVGDAVSAALSGDVKKLNEAMEGLAPSAQKVVRELLPFSNQLKQIRTDTQQAFFAQLTGDITALGKSLLGPIRRGMTETATEAGRLADGLADVAARARNASVVEQVFKSTARVFEQLNAPMQRFTQGLFDWISATLPAFDGLIDSLSEGVSRFGQFLTTAANSGQALAWVNNAVNTLSQLWQVAKNLAGVLSTVFDAARDASGGYLQNINQALLATRNFFAAGEGRAALIEIFTGLHQVLQAMAAPLKEIVLQLGAVARVAGNVATSLSQGVTDLIRGLGQAIKQAGPGLETFAKALSGLFTDIGSVLPGVGESLGRLLTAISPLAAMFGLVARAAAGVLEVVSSLPSGLLTAVAAFVTLRALGIPNMFTQIGSSARGAAGTVGTSLQTIATSYATSLSSLQQFRAQQAQTAQVMGGGTGPALGLAGAFTSLGDRARAAGSALAGPLMTGLRGLMGAIGGPVGLALIAVSFMLSRWSEQHQKAQQEVAEHNQRVQALAGTLNKFTGSITSATRAMAQQQFSQGPVSEAARRLGVSIGLVADAATNSIPAQRSLGTILQRTTVDALNTNAEFANGKKVLDLYGVGVETATAASLNNKDAQDQLRGAIQRYHDGLGPLERIQHDVNDSYEDMLGWIRKVAPDQATLASATQNTAADLSKMAEATRKANEQFSPMSTLADSLADAMDTLASSTSTAEEKARALDSALRILSGGTLSMQDANQKAVGAFQSGGKAIDELGAKYAIAGKSAKALGISSGELKTRQDELGKSLFDSAGNVNFYSERANALFNVSKDLRQATLDQTAAIVDNAQKTGGDLAQAHQRAADVMTNARNQVIDWAKELGFGQTEAERFADSLGLFPDKVSVAFEMQGAPAALKELALIKGRVEVLPDKRTLRLDSNAAPLRADLEKLGFIIRDIPGTKDFTVEANTKDAQAALDTFIRQGVLQRRPDLIIGGNIDLAKASAEDIRKFIQSLPVAMKPTVDPTAATSGMTGLLAGLKPPVGTPTIIPGVDPAPAKSQIGSLLDELIPKPGTPKITPGIDGDPALKGLGGLLGGLTPPTGTPLITPGIDPGTAQRQMPGLLGQLIPPAGQPQIAPGINPGPAINSLNGLLLPSIFNSHADVGVGINPAAAQIGLQGFVAQANAAHGTVGLTANPGPAFNTLAGFQVFANNARAGVTLLANAGLAYAVVEAFIFSTNRRTATIDVRARVSGDTSIQAAQGGIFQYFRDGGITHRGRQMKPMSAAKPAIVPPNSMRVIGDRKWGKEAFIPLVRTAQSISLLRTAAQELDFDLVRRSRTQQTQRSVSFEPGAIVVNAPQSDPRLVARSVLNELTREATF